MLTAIYDYLTTPHLEPDQVDVWTRGTPTRQLIAASIRNERRERGAMICWRYSRDRVVEQREQKAARSRWPRLVRRTA